MRVKDMWAKSPVRATLRSIALSVLSLRIPEPKGVSNVYFHSIPPRYGKEFEYLLDVLQMYGRIVSLKEALERQTLVITKPAFTISFDDGFKDNATVAAPIIYKKGIPATFFVATGFMGLKGTALKKFTREKLKIDAEAEPMTWEDMQRCADYGIEIGSHGVNHRSFSELSDFDAEQELAESKEAIERCISRKVQYVAWPFGTPQHFPARCLDIAQRIGYRAVFSGVSRRSSIIIPSGTLHRRHLDMAWGTRVCTYFSVRG